MIPWRKYAGLWALYLGIAVTTAQAQQLEAIRVHMHGAEGYAADGTLYSPSKAPPYAAIILVPDERGVTTRVTDAASYLVEQGYLVVALDLNRGQSADVAFHSDEQSIHDLDAAVTFVSAQSSVVHDAIGLLGWQSGGAYAVRYAGDPRIRAVAIIDASRNSEPIDGAKSRAPIFAAFAGRNASPSKQVMTSFQAEARRRGSALTLKIYPSADIGFDDPGDATRYREADATDLHRRESDFFSQHLHR